MLNAANILKQYGNLQVLKGVDLSIAKSEIVSIVG
ncbi:MAG: lipoprotein-releasing system ATP-binding protein LolD, partial [Chitinophagaceae bacterium]